MPSFFLSLDSPRLFTLPDKNCGPPIAGDGYEFGFYDGTNFVKRTDAIIVTPNYRVSSLGFLATPEMQAEDPNGSTGNYGLQDQTAALQV